MKSIRIPVALAAVLVVGVLAGTAVSQATFSPAKIGFVDVAEVFLKYKDAANVEADARQQLKDLEIQMRASYEELRKKRAELDILLEGTQEYRDKKREIDLAAMKLDYEEKQKRQMVLEDAAKRMNAVYTRIRGEAENYAVRNGLDAVYMVNAKQIEARSLEQLQLLVATRPVLYWNPSYDITGPVIETLNK